MNDDETGKPTLAERHAAARARLRKQAETHPDQVKRIEARIALLTAAQKRQRAKERVEHLALGTPRDIAKPTKSKKRGRRRVVTKAAPVPISPGLNEAVELREKWSHKLASGAHPETLEHATNTHTGALAQLHANGTIDADQLEWAAEIANVYRSIESGVAVKVASLEARVDHAGSGRDQAGESVRRVRLHLAYGMWRDDLPAPKALVLDMIVGDAVGYSVAAARHHVHKRKAKRLLIAALNRWPDSVQRAYREVSADDIIAMNRAA